MTAQPGKSRRHKKPQTRHEFPLSDHLGHALGRWVVPSHLGLAAAGLFGVFMAKGQEGAFVQKLLGRTLGHGANAPEKSHLGPFSVDG